MKFLDQEIVKEVIEQIILWIVLITMCWVVFMLLGNILLVQDMIREIVTTEYTIKFPIK